MEKDPLLKWNQLNVNNAENALIEIMADGIIDSVTALDKFSGWMLAVTGATIAILITNIQAILPYLSVDGFKLSGLMLGISGVAGIIAKYFSVLCQNQSEISKKIKVIMLPVFEKHSIDEETIISYAKQRNIEILTEINMPRVMDNFFKLFPNWIYKFMNRRTKKMMSSLHERLKPQIRVVIWFGNFLLLQTIFYIIFVVIALVYAQNSQI